MVRKWLCKIIFRVFLPVPVRVGNVDAMTNGKHYSRADQAKATIKTEEREGGWNEGADCSTRSARTADRSTAFARL